MFNLKNSYASFGLNVLDEVKEITCNKITVKTNQPHLRYLGLPSTFGKSRKEFFSLVVCGKIERVEGRFSFKGRKRNVN